MKFNVTRTDDFIVKKSNNRRNPISEVYNLSLDINENDSLYYLNVKFPEGIASILSSFQPFVLLGKLMKDSGLNENVELEIEFDKASLEMEIVNKDIILQDISSFKSHIIECSPSDWTDDIESSFTYFRDSFEKYIVKDIEIIFSPISIDDVEDGYYKSPVFINAEAARIERDDVFLYIESVKGEHMVQNIFGASLRKTLKDFESFNLLVDESKDLHVSYHFWKIDRGLNIVSSYTNLYRANSKLTDKRIYTKIERIDQIDSYH